MQRPSETLLVGGFLVGAALGVYAMWAGAVATLVVLGFGILGMLGAVMLSILSRVDLRRLVALLTEEER